MIDRQGKAAEDEALVTHRDPKGLGGGPHPSGKRAFPYRPVLVSKPRTREEVARLWLTLLIVCVIGAAFYYGVAKLLIALGIF